MLPDTISVAYEDYVSTLTTTSDFPKLRVLTYENPNHRYAMNKYGYCVVRVKRGYCSRKRDKNMQQQKTRFYFSMCFDKYKKLYYCRGFLRNETHIITRLVEHQRFMEKIFSWFLCLSPFHPSLYLLKSFSCLFSSCSIDHSLFQSFHMIWLKFWPCTFYIDCLNACDDSSSRQLICTDHLHGYNRL